MGRDTIQLETIVNTISHEYLLEFTSEYGISETLHLELHGPEDRIVDFPEGKVDERVFPTVVDWRTNAPKDKMPADGTYSVEAVRALDTHHGRTDRSDRFVWYPSTIERSLLDFAHEAGTSDRGTAAPEMPLPEDVPPTAAPGAGQAEETAATEPHVARESRKRGHDGID
nr:hypothetical protein [Tanacetum cinerariifolium]